MRIGCPCDMPRSKHGRWRSMRAGSVGAPVLAALDSITTAAYDSTANHDAPKRSEWQESPVNRSTGGAFSLGRTVLAALATKLLDRSVDRRVLA